MKETIKLLERRMSTGIVPEKRPKGIIIGRVSTNHCVGGNCVKCARHH